LKFQLSGNQTLLLDDPEVAWQVISGSVMVFALQTRADGSPGLRHYLLACEPGEALFGSLAEQGWRLLAIAEAAADLQMLTLTNPSLAQPALNQSNLGASWLSKLARSLADRQVFWQPPVLDSSSEQHGTNGKMAPTLGVDRSQLVQIHQDFFRKLNQAVRQAELESQARFQARQFRDRQMTETALTQLAALVEPAAQELPFAGWDQQGIGPVSLGWTPADSEAIWLYQAMRQIGLVLGVTIRQSAAVATGRSREPLTDLAEASRLRWRRVLLGGDWWHQDCGPILGYLRPDRIPVALIPKPRGQYEVINPQQRTQKLLDTETLNQLSPVAYMFYRPLRDRAMDLLDLWRFGLVGTARDWTTIAWSGVAVALLGMLVPQMTAVLVDVAIPTGDRSLLWQMGLGLLAAAIGGGLFQLLQGVAINRLETVMESAMQSAIWDRLLNLDIPFFRQYASGDLRTRASAINTIRRLVSGALVRNLFSSGFLLLNLLLLFYYSSILATIALGLGVALLATTLLAGRLMLQKVSPLYELEGQLFGQVVQLISGNAKLRIAGAENRAFAQLSQLYARQQRYQLHLQRVKDTMAVVNQVLPIVGSALLFAAVVAILQRPEAARFTTGTFLAFNLAFGSFLVAMSQFSDTVLDVLVVTGLAQRLRPILQAEPEVNDRRADPGHLSGRLALERVTFAYQAGGRAVLNDISIQVEPREFIALVGPSGSGKSTIFRLLLGFEVPQSGRVSYDNQDLRGLDVQAVRRQLGVLLQSGRTSTASIFDNIAGSALITMDDAWEAARHAGLADDIAAMPMGMHTMVSEGGTNLSGGQRQRLLIARALALKPQILLFDEATSFLDNRTQAIVSRSLEQLRITRVVIAHRLSTVQNADRIYVLDRGQIVQQGTYTSLMQEPGIFQRLMQAQVS